MFVSNVNIKRTCYVDYWSKIVGQICIPKRHTRMRPTLTLVTYIKTNPSSWIPQELNKGKNKPIIPLTNSLFKKKVHVAKQKIKKIPKNSTIDPRLLFQYRGIAMLSTLYKLYASVLNNRLLNILKKIIYMLKSKIVLSKTDYTVHVLP